MAAPFIVTGLNEAALFTLKVYRGESMVLMAMNWKAASLSWSLPRASRMDVECSMLWAGRLDSLLGCTSIERVPSKF